MKTTHTASTAAVRSVKSIIAALAAGVRWGKAVDVCTPAFKGTDSEGARRYPKDPVRALVFSDAAFTAIRNRS